MDNKVKAIIFDKDGTLMQFDPFWLPVSLAATEEIAQSLGIEQHVDRVRFALGLYKASVDAKGILCAGTYQQIADVFNAVPQQREKNCSVTSTQVAQIFEKHVREGRILPACENLPSVLDSLIARGIKLFVVTTDNPAITEICLSKLGVTDKFERIYCDDGKHATKPNPQIIEEILADYGFERESLCMVGDTLNDVKFAKNGRITSICVGRGDACKQADYSLGDVSRLVEVIS